MTAVDIIVVYLLLMDYHAITCRPGGYAMYSKFVIGCSRDAIGRRVRKCVVEIRMYRPSKSPVYLPLSNERRRRLRYQTSRRVLLMAPTSRGGSTCTATLWEQRKHTVMRQDEQGSAMRAILIRNQR